MRCRVIKLAFLVHTTVDRPAARASSRKTQGRVCEWTSLAERALGWISGTRIDTKLQSAQGIEPGGACARDRPLPPAVPVHSALRDRAAQSRRLTERHNSVARSRPCHLPLARAIR